MTVCRSYRPGHHTHVGHWLRLRDSADAVVVQVVAEGDGLLRLHAADGRSWRVWHHDDVPAGLPAAPVLYVPAWHALRITVGERSTRIVNVEQRS